MKAKDFLNYKKPHFWTALIAILVLGFAGVVSVLDKEEPAKEVEAPAEEIEVEVEEPETEPEKTVSQIIIERFSTMDWDEVEKNAKKFGEDGWEEGIVLLAELPEDKIFLYGYNDEEYQLRGVAVEIDGNVNYFDWEYTSKRTNICPEVYWNEEASQLQITLNLFDGEGINAEELHVLVVYDTKTMEDFVLRSEDYLAEIEDRMEGTGQKVGSYVDIQLGKTMRMVFEPTQTEDGEEKTLKLHQAVISLVPSKDGHLFEIGDIGVEPEKREAVIEIEGTKEEYTEIQYISENGYSIWYPESVVPMERYGHEGFASEEGSEDAAFHMVLVPEGDMSLDEAYLKEAAGNFKASGEYKKVTVSKIKKLTAEDKKVTIKKIQVVHDETADWFYLVKGKKQTLLITVSMPTEGMEGWGARADQMIRTISFVDQESE